MARIDVAGPFGIVDCRFSIVEWKPKSRFLAYRFASARNDKGEDCLMARIDVAGPFGTVDCRFSIVEWKPKSRFLAYRLRFGSE